MKIQYFSDLHTVNLDINDYIDDTIDLVIAAGDIVPGVLGIQWLSQFPQPVLYIPGNHEFYGKSFKNHLRKMKLKSDETNNVKFLYNETYKHDGVLFHGTTLWTDYNINNNFSYDYKMAPEVMNDYRKIRYENGSKLYPKHLLEEHQIALRFLNDNVNEGDVIIMHHAPHINSSIKYKDDQASAYYISNLENFILDKKPSYIIHGHTHEPANYNIGNTTVLSNPKGYVLPFLKEDENKDFYQKKYFIL